MVVHDECHRVELLRRDVRVVGDDLGDGTVIIAACSPINERRASFRREL
jgi:hypothetical protein